MSTLVSLPGATPVAAPDYQSLERPLNFTESAAAKVKSLIQEEGNPDLALRVYIEGGGCSGFQYKFGLADGVESDDSVAERDGVKLVVDSVSLDLVRGCSVDFVETLGGTAFRVENPQAASGCGCGSSFAI